VAEEREPDDARVAKGLRERDPVVLRGLVERHKDRLFRYLLRLAGDRDTAEELFQETWLRVVDRGHQYEPSRSFLAWLLTIARHLFIDLLRRSDPRRLAGFETPAEDAAPSPFDQLAERERQELVARRFRALSPAVQEVLTLRLDHGLSLREIATVTGTPLPTVKARLYRGASALAEATKEGPS
jgi:RNA polymerase sigma-70 factor (ECF subfamily)